MIARIAGDGIQGELNEVVGGTAQRETINGRLSDVSPP
jgi:hypothetical protein